MTPKVMQDARPVLAIGYALWTLRKGTCVAEARVRPHPLGQELRFLVNGELLWSEVFKPGRGVDLGELAEAKRREFIATGWAPDNGMSDNFSQEPGVAWQ